LLEKHLEFLSQYNICIDDGERVVFVSRERISGILLDSFKFCIKFVLSSVFSTEIEFNKINLNLYRFFKSKYLRYLI